MDSDSQASESGIPLAQFDSDQQQMVYLTADGSSYILPAQSGAEGEGLVTYIYGGDGTTSDAAGDIQGSESDIQYLLVSADEASGLDQQFVVMPPESMETGESQSEDSASKQLQVVSPAKKSEVIKLDIGKKSESTSTIVIAPGSGGSESVGTTAEVKVKGGTARVTILPASAKSPTKGTTATSCGVTTIPIRFVSRSDSSTPATQTISLPVKSTPKVTVSVKSTASSLPPAIVSLPKVTVISATSASSTPSTAASTPKKIGRPRKDAVKEESKDPLHQLTKPGGVSKIKSSNVIVVPIQISKEMIAAKQSGSEPKSSTKDSDTPVSSDSEKEKPKGKVGGKASDKGSPSKDKGKEATPAAAKSSAKKQAAKAEPKPTEVSPTMLPTRRSKRESTLSAKLAEWGLLPSSGKSHSAAEEEESESDDDDKKEDEDGERKEVDEDEDVPLSKTAVTKTVDKTPKSSASTPASTSKSSAATPAKSTMSTPSTSTKVTASTSTTPAKTLSSTPASSVKTAVSTPSVTPKVTTVSTPAVKVATTSSGNVSVKKTVTIAKESGSQTPIIIKPNSPMASANKVLTPSTGILKKTPAPSSSQQSSSTTPKLLQNKSLMCKPIMMTKATSCNPIRITKATQTDEDTDSIFSCGGSGSKTIVPLPVPIFVPTPMAMFSMPTPYPMPVPLPIPVPCFIPTTRNSIAAIMKQLQELHDSLPSDPFEADVLKMAEAVAEARDEPDHSNDRKSVVNGAMSESLAVMQQDGSSDMSVDVLEMALRMASETGDDSGRDTKSTGKSNGMESSSRPAAKRPRLADDGLPDEDDVTDDLQQPLSSPLVVAEPLRGPAPAPILHTPINDAHMRLKYSYGINAWKQWVTTKNAEIEASGATRSGARGVPSMKLFKSEILQCGSEELSIALSHFVRELRKPTGEKYSPDSIYYLCLGIQHYLFENGRIDNIFADVYYERFNDALHELLSSCEVRLNTQGLIVCRVSEEHLWEARQLGAHSPRVLLHTLVYFNTKYFMLQNAESHMALSFSNILKQWKKNTNTADGKPIRSVYLRYNTIGYSPTQPGSSAAGGLDSAIHRRRTLDPTPYEQLENVDNPLRCPVKLYEFYLSKCPESIRNRNDVFYLMPEPSCVPSSPVWYSAQPLSAELMNKMLGRIRVVREIQESQLNQAPAIASTATAVTASMFG